MPDNLALIQRDREVAKFMAAVRSTAVVWKSIDVRTVCVQFAGEWHNLVTRCVLDAREPDAIPLLHSLPETSDLACRQEIWAAQDLGTLLSQFQEGAFWLCGTRIIAAFSNTQTLGADVPNEPYTQGYSWLPGTFDIASPAGPVRVSGHRLELRDAMGNAPLRAHVQSRSPSFDAGLRTLAQPWDGIKGLVRVAVQYSEGYDGVEESRIEVLAPLEASLVRDRTSLRAGELKGAVWAASSNVASLCTIGFIAEMRDGQYVNDSFTLEKSTDSIVGNTLPFSYTLPRNSRSVKLFVRIGPHIVESQKFDDTGSDEANVDLACHSTLDPELNSLRAALSLSDRSKPTGRMTVASQFEGAVARLFSIAGFHSDLLDVYVGMKDAIDVLARTPDGKIVVAIECTLGALQSSDGKPDRLKRRADALVDALPPQTEVIRVIATSRRRDALLPSELEAAALDRTVILAGQDLLEILDRLIQGASASDVVRLCRERVPARSDGHSLSHFMGRFSRY